MATTIGLTCFLLAVLLSTFHSVQSLPRVVSEDGKEAQLGNISKSLVADNSTVQLRQRRSSYHNDWDERLYRECLSGYGMYHVVSEHDNRKEDRRWRWECRQLIQNPHQTCSWTAYQNEFDDPILFMCGRGGYLRGVDSYHNNGHEDRRWRFQCCFASGYTTKSCELSGYTNSWDGPMNFQARHGAVITGVFSHHNNDKEDRLWKFEVCDYSQ